MKRDGPSGPPYPNPAWAYVPGQNARHPDGTFDQLCVSVRPGMTSAELAQTDAWLAGLQFIDAGYFWEAHEVIEPVWMAIPDAWPERKAVQVVIQIANANLKLRMGRPKAVLRICAIAESLLADGHAGCSAMGVNRRDLKGKLESLCKAANRMRAID